VFGLPDWDLIFKGFLDVGRTFISDRLSFEDDETLIGAGVGLELIYRRNLNLRVDWGFALEDVDSTDTDAGSSRVHFVGTILF
jgi:hemolysin activation/secretion protein